MCLKRGVLGDNPWLCIPPERGSTRLFIPCGPQKVLLSLGGLFRPGLRCTVGPRLAGMRWWGCCANSPLGWEQAEMCS